MFSRHLNTYIVLCLESYYDCNETFPRKPRISGKVGLIWIGFLLERFWMQTSLLILSFVGSNVCENRHPNESWLNTNFTSSLEFCFGAPTVLHISFSVDKWCLQPLLLISSLITEALLEWFSSMQWNFHCF